MKAVNLFIASILLFFSCSKQAENIINKDLSSSNDPKGFTRYTIRQGSQFCDQSIYAAVETNQMNFIVLFDSSAIYQTSMAENQDDINKLFGFSDNNSDHHQYSARFGWRWSDHALRLFAYVYNEGERISKEISTVNIGKEINCSIQVKGDHYVFTADGVTETMPRIASTEKGKGYQLYPYFGGDEVAPHEINIWIRTIDTGPAR
jgi:hypothetical protein